MGLPACRASLQRVHCIAKEGGNGLCSSEILERGETEWRRVFQCECPTPLGSNLARLRTRCTPIPQLPNASVVVYHFVVDGGAFALIPDGPSMTLDLGDIMLYFLQSNAHCYRAGITIQGSPTDLGNDPRRSKRTTSVFCEAGAAGAPHASFASCIWHTDALHLGRPVFGGLLPPKMFKVNIRTDAF